MEIIADIRWREVAKSLRVDINVIKPSNDVNICNR